ncbi:Tetratricopeptide TPR_2 repeat protein [Pyrobaculum ferrireducens]|uniref:Tetratricopeptide TPR_2 repeat protein n=1 Tax=Pyrobaculum ferrireducens TaxID=1104324 RepID=G7VGJ1_9CREN|nr:Tetratricopeptide TPR_2 repeat protein [Pyrobaculum ferrireducens]
MIHALLLLAAPHVLAAAFGIALYQDRGIPVEVSVNVSRGSGYVNIEGLYYYDDSLWYSTVFACWEAAISAGADPFSYNYTVYIAPINASRSLAGPSLSLAVYIATYSTITGSPVNSSVVYTGTVAPGGVVDFVGGVEQKAEGAARYGFKLFVYPALQHLEFKMVEKPRLIGVYGSLVPVLEITPIQIRNITAIEVGNVYQAAAATTGRYNATANIERLREVLTRTNATAPQYKIDALINEVNRAVKKAKRLAAQQPRYHDALAAGIGKALAYVEISRNITAASTEALPRALAEVLTPYFYVLFVTDFERGRAVAEIYLATLRNITEALRPAVGADNICDAAVAHAYIHTAEMAKSTAERSLTSYMLTGDVTYAAEASYWYSQAAYYLWKAILLSREPTTGLDLNKTLAKIGRYVQTAVEYGDVYSRATGVTSPQLLEGGAKLNLLRALAAQQEGRGEAALGYYIEALASLLAYFAIHPGFPNTTGVKYMHYLDAVAHVAAPVKSIYAAEAAALAEAAGLNDTKILYMAKIHACIIAEKLAVAGDGAPHRMLRYVNYQAPAPPPQPPGEMPVEITALGLLLLVFIVKVLHHLSRRR